MTNLDTFVKRMCELNRGWTTPDVGCDENVAVWSSDVTIFTDGKIRIDSLKILDLAPEEYELITELKRHLEYLKIIHQQAKNDLEAIEKNIIKNQKVSDSVKELYAIGN